MACVLLSTEGDRGRSGPDLRRQDVQRTVGLLLFALVLRAMLNAAVASTIMRVDDLRAAATAACTRAVIANRAAQRRRCVANPAVTLGTSFAKRAGTSLRCGFYTGGLAGFARGLTGGSLSDTAAKSAGRRCTDRSFLAMSAPICDGPVTLCRGLALLSFGPG
jgi:hypothetical protein